MKPAISRWPLISGMGQRWLVTTGMGMLLQCALLAACERQPTTKNSVKQAETKTATNELHPTIMIYESLMRGMAQSGCGLMTDEETGSQRACNEAAVKKQRSFSGTLQASLASDPECRSVKFGLKDIEAKPIQPKIPAGPVWLLWVEFSPSHGKQPWSLMGLANLRDFRGEGTADQIAHSICSIAMHRGGELLK